MNTLSRPAGVTAISLFFGFGATASGLSALMLTFPGTPLDGLWRLNPHAHDGFAGMGPWAVALMATVCAACLAVALGLWRCRRWGLWGAIAVFCIDLAGDTANALFYHDLRPLIGIPVAGAMVAYLLSRKRVFKG